MQNTLLIRMEIPIQPAMMFNQWLPIEQNDFIQIDNNHMQLKFWFDLTCTSHLGELDESELSRWKNIGTTKIFADVTVKNVRNELLEYIKTEANSSLPHTKVQQLKEEYRQLGKDVCIFALKSFNRLISYTRTQLGQYWLQEYSNNQFHSWFQAKAKIDESDWIWWLPPQAFPIILQSRTSDERFLNKSSWEKSKEFIISSSRTDLVLELLAGAELLAENGHSRSALTEAVTALERAVHKFGNDDKANQCFGPIMASRLGTETLKNQIDHMGLTGTINYLFPIIFTEQQIPTNLLKVCQEAISVRQNVVHNGQRQVDGTKLRSFISSIRTLCDTLNTFQDEV